jgi:hypothetical protein
MNTTKWIIFIIAGIFLSIIDEFMRQNKNPLYNVYNGIKNGVLLIAVLKYIM